MVKLIDLSVLHQNAATEPFGPKIEHSDHLAGASRLAKMAGIEATDFPDTMAWATDFISARSCGELMLTRPFIMDRPVKENRLKRWIKYRWNGAMVQGSCWI